MCVHSGGIVSVSGEWDVKPRIIFISDGFPTESTASVAGDVASNITNVRSQMFGCECGCGVYV